ncbi:MAG: hypothetical protein HGA96_00320 [Desulfobulbaceae bacterium]|nr:hypothetical protein [Desulfobulbaceae bacterium]
MSGINKREEPFVIEIRRTLEERNASLSPEILGKLDAINRDLGSLGNTHGFGTRRLTQMFAAGLMGAVMILLLALIFYPGEEPLINNLDNLDIFTAKEDPDFFIDLEFYAWLDSTSPKAEATTPNQETGK